MAKKTFREIDETKLIPLTSEQEKIWLLGRGMYYRLIGWCLIPLLLTFGYRFLAGMAGLVENSFWNLLSFFKSISICFAVLALCWATTYFWFMARI